MISSPSHNSMGSFVSPISASSSSYVQCRFSFRSSKASDSRKVALAIAQNTLAFGGKSTAFELQFFLAGRRDFRQADPYEIFSQALVLSSQFSRHRGRRR